MVAGGSSTNGERERDGWIEESRAERGSGGGDLECLSIGRAEDSSHNMPGRIYGLAGGLGLS